MAHVRDNCKNLSFCYSIPEPIYNEVQKYRHKKGLDYRNEALNQLIMKGLRYEEIVEKKRMEKVLC